MQLSEKLGKYPEGRNEGSEKSHQPAFLKHRGRWVSKNLPGIWEAGMFSFQSRTVKGAGKEPIESC